MIFILVLLSLLADIVFFLQQCESQTQRAPAALKECQEGVAEWEKQLQILKRILPLEAAYFKLVKDDIPVAERAGLALNDKLEPARAKAQEVSYSYLF